MCDWKEGEGREGGALVGEVERAVLWEMEEVKDLIRFTMLSLWKEGFCRRERRERDKVADNS